MNYMFASWHDMHPSWYNHFKNICVITAKTRHINIDNIMASCTPARSVSTLEPICHLTMLPNDDFLSVSRWLILHCPQCCCSQWCGGAGGVCNFMCGPPVWMAGRAIVSQIVIIGPLVRYQITFAMSFTAQQKSSQLFASNFLFTM